jgi:hypothetical protein
MIRCYDILFSVSCQVSECFARVSVRLVGLSFRAVAFKGDFVFDSFCEE